MFSSIKIVNILHMVNTLCHWHISIPCCFSGHQAIAVKLKSVTGFCFHFLTQATFIGRVTGNCRRAMSAEQMVGISSQCYFFHIKKKIGLVISELNVRSYPDIHRFEIRLLIQGWNCCVNFWLDKDGHYSVWQTFYAYSTWTDTRSFHEP